MATIKSVLIIKCYKYNTRWMWYIASAILEWQLNSRWFIFSVHLRVICTHTNGCTFTCAPMQFMRITCDVQRSRRRDSLTGGRVNSDSKTLTYTHTNTHKQHTNTHPKHTTQTHPSPTHTHTHQSTHQKEKSSEHTQMHTQYSEVTKHTNQ